MSNPQLSDAYCMLLSFSYLNVPISQDDFDSSHFDLPEGIIQGKAINIVELANIFGLAISNSPPDVRVVASYYSIYLAREKVKSQRTTLMPSHYIKGDNPTSAGDLLEIQTRSCIYNYLKHASQNTTYKSLFPFLEGEVAQTKCGRFKHEVMNIPKLATIASGRWKHLCENAKLLKNQIDLSKLINNDYDAALFPMINLHMEPHRLYYPTKNTSHSFDEMIKIPLDSDDYTKGQVRFLHEPLTTFVNNKQTTEIPQQPEGFNKTYDTSKLYEDTHMNKYTYIWIQDRNLKNAIDFSQFSKQINTLKDVFGQSFTCSIYMLFVSIEFNGEFIKQRKSEEERYAEENNINLNSDYVVIRAKELYNKNNQKTIVPDSVTPVILLKEGVKKLIGDVNLELIEAFTKKRVLPFPLAAKSFIVKKRRVDSMQSGSGSGQQQGTIIIKNGQNNLITPEVILLPSTNAELRELIKIKYEFTDAFVISNEQLCLLNDINVIRSGATILAFASQAILDEIRQNQMGGAKSAGSQEQQTQEQKRACDELKKLNRAGLREWLKQRQLSENAIEALYKEEYNGAGLLTVNKDDLKKYLRGGAVASIVAIFKEELGLELK
ncbi:hypothetical protein AKO1_013899 [Acrasis kona]|uniref:SAM domain-containing protein n=1 Tax=Acrasis kona TaxID=1008807 RepID=A0AAW2YKM7_9EUKA